MPRYLVLAFLAAAVALSSATAFAAQSSKTNRAPIARPKVASRGSKSFAPVGAITRGPNLAAYGGIQRSAHSTGVARMRGTGHSTQYNIYATRR